MLSQNCLNFYDNENLTLQIDFPGHLDAFSEAVAQRFSLKRCSQKFRKIHWKTTMPGHGVFSCEFCEISKNNFFYGSPPLAASAFLGLMTRQNHPDLENIPNLTYLRFSHHKKLTVTNFWCQKIIFSLLINDLVFSALWPYGIPPSTKFYGHFCCPTFR